MNNIGIRHIEIALPPKIKKIEEMATLTKSQAKEMHEKVRVKQKPVLSEGEKIVDIAIDSVKKLLQEKAIDAKTLDYIIFATGSISLEFTCVASKVAKNVSAHNAQCFEVTHGCNAGSLALEIARGFLINHKKFRALILCADELNALIDYSKKEMESILCFSDGCAIILLENSCSVDNQLIRYEAISAPLFYDFMKKDEESGKLYFENASRQVKGALKKAYIKNTIKIIDDLLIAEQLPMEQLKHIFINQGNPWLIDALIEHYNLEEHIVCRTHEEFGHMGGVDSFYGVFLRKNRGGLRKGEYFLLLTSGVGFAWSGHLIQY